MTPRPFDLEIQLLSRKSRPRQGRALSPPAIIQEENTAGIVSSPPFVPISQARRSQVQIQEEKSEPPQPR
jgi:hypothetical protein